MPKARVGYNCPVIKSDPFLKYYIIKWCLLKWILK